MPPSIKSQVSKVNSGIFIDIKGKASSAAAINYALKSIFCIVNTVCGVAVYVGRLQRAASLLLGLF